MKGRPQSDARRNADLATIHMAGKHLFGDVSKGGAGRDDYEDWLEKHTGKRSAGKLGVKERIALIGVIRAQGLLPDRRPGGAGRTPGGADRPTSDQWGMIGHMARRMGWREGLDDWRLHAFVKRTAKVSSTRFLDRDGATKVILGLKEWVRQRHEQQRRDMAARMGDGDGVS